ncbi:hypothetical protein DSM104299_05347 [Baekduia alba]|uniref:hypothetical protein n=1 Tax=Baekduia alba TaxID=2997333 RepID=UPI002340B07E|nr:hypothetical protein [Baekduia alba]WCB96583.1 hypothetical protein DSM104299_05347 [Baekduia alba]
MRSRLGTLGGFAAVVVVGVLAFALIVTLRQTPKAFTVGVQSGGVAVSPRAGQTACQAPLDVPRGGAFDRVRLKLGTYRKAGPPLDVLVRRGIRGPVLAHGTLPGGYPDITTDATQVVGLDRKIAAGTSGLAVCVKNGGPNRVALYGNGDAANRTSTATLDGKPASVDIDMIFERAPRSYGSELSTILSRAVLFRSPRLSDTLYFLVLALLVAAAIAGVAVALRSVDDEPPAT